MSSRKSDSHKHEENEKRGVFSHVGSFFGWLGDLITEQARLEAHKEEVHPPVHILREITLQQQKTGEVIQNAETICCHLDEIKQKLTQEFGASSACFISKCIDPMIEHARYLTKALKEPHKEEKHLGSILSQAIESVELYSQFSDEKKLKKRIVQVAQGMIKQSIDKDLEVLINYKTNALKLCSWKGFEREANEFQLDGYLYPIISELIGMAESHVVTDDLHAFFVWKSNVDDRRNSLVELGLLTIDAMTNPSHEVVVSSDEEIVLEEPFSQLVKHNLENSSFAMSFLSTLEDRVNDVYSRIHDNTSYDQVQELVDYLKADAERFGQISSHTKHVLDSFQKIKERIGSLEELLIQMRD